MKRMMMWMVVMTLFCLLAGCDAVSNSTLGDDSNTPTADETAAPPAEEQREEDAPPPPYTSVSEFDAATPLGNTIVVFNSNWMDPVGNLTAISVADLSDVDKALITSDGSDAVVRSFGNRIYVVNRFGTDTVQAIDPATFNVLADFSVGAGTNPQDIVVVSDAKAYVSRLDAQNGGADTSDVLIVNPLTGEILGGFDLKPYTVDDGERLARAAQMVLVGKLLYVCLQDLPADMLKSADTNGKVAIIDTETDQLVDADPATAGVQVIQLAGRNPSDITYSAANERLYVADTGVYVMFVVDTTDGNGGIEAIRTSDNTSEGIVVDDADLGGGVNQIRLVSAELGFTITDAVTVASFNPKTHAVVSTNIYTTPGFFLPDIAIDPQGRLLVTEQDVGDPGIVVLDTDGTKLAGPIGVGAPPSSITFVERP